MAKGMTFLRRSWTWCLAALGLASAPMAIQAQQLAPKPLEATNNSVSSNQAALFVEVAPKDSVLAAVTQGKPPNA